VDELVPPVLADVRSLLDRPEGTAPPSRAAVEHTLTSGYAYALELEGERLRIERRLRTLVRSGGDSAREISELHRLLAEAEGELASVRALLSNARAQALA
jgi:hypothetical protein